MIRQKLALLVLLLLIIQVSEAEASRPHSFGLGIGVWFPATLPNTPKGSVGYQQLGVPFQLGPRYQYSGKKYLLSTGVSYDRLAYFRHFGGRTCELARSGTNCYYIHIDDRFIIDGYRFFSAVGMRSPLKSLGFHLGNEIGYESAQVQTRVNDSGGFSSRQVHREYMTLSALIRASYHFLVTPSFDLGFIHRFRPEAENEYSADVLPKDDYFIRANLDILF